MGTGTVLALLETRADDRAGLAAAAREAVFAALLGEPSSAPAPGAAGAASALLAQLDTLTILSAGERRLLAEWLERIAATRS